MDFFTDIEREGSAWNTKGKNILLTLSKKDKDAEHWPRITKEKIKNSLIKVDWDRWVEEDEEDEEGSKGMDNFDPSKMNQFEAQSESKSGYQAGDLLEQRNVVSCDYFTVQENAKTVVDLIETDEEGRYWLDVSEKKQISHDTIVLKFKFP